MAPEPPAAATPPKPDPAPAAPPPPSPPPERASPLGRLDVDHPYEQLAPSPWDDSLEFARPAEASDAALVPLDELDDEDSDFDAQLEDMASDADLPLSALLGPGPEAPEDAEPSPMLLPDNLTRPEKRTVRREALPAPVPTRSNDDEIGATLPSPAWADGPSNGMRRAPAGSETPTRMQPAMSDVELEPERPQVRSGKLKRVSGDGSSRRRRVAPTEVPAPTASPASAPVLRPASRPQLARPDSSETRTRHQPVVESGAWRRTPWAVAKPHTFLRGMAILSMLVLFEAWAIPTVGTDLHLQAPWVLVQGVGSLTFLAAVFFGGLLLFAAIPMPYIARATLMTVAGATLLVFGILQMQAEVAAFAFRGHPGLAFAFAGEPGVLALLLVSLLFPTALFWRARYTASFWSRIAVLLGVLTVAACYFLLGAIAGSEGSAPLVELFRAAGDSNLYLGNRISVFVLLLPLPLIILSALVFLKHPRSGGAGLWAWLYVTVLGAIPLLQAGFVSTWRGGQWKSVLAPLKVSLFLYAGLLLAPVALGHLIGELERLIRLRSAKARG